MVTLLLEQAEAAEVKLLLDLTEKAEAKTLPELTEAVELKLLPELPSVTKVVAVFLEQAPAARINLMEAES